ncbi:MAG: hypothetical protein ABI460_04520 [Caldimonas sp.]
MRERFQRRLSHASYAGGTTSESHRLAPWQRRVLYLSGVALLATGAAWLLVHYSRAMDALPSPAEPWLMRAHGFGAFAALFVLGALAASHVPRGWRLANRRDWQQQRRTGFILCTLGAALALTGYLLYYFAPETVRPALGWLHSGLGVAMAIFVVAHRRGGARTAEASRS